MHPDMRDLEKLEERPTDSMQRYEAINGRLQQLKEKAKTKDAQDILSDHPRLVCSHREESQLGTLWSIIATLKKPTVYRAEDHPCKTRYKMDRRLATVTK